MAKPKNPKKPKFFFTMYFWDLSLLGDPYILNGHYAMGCVFKSKTNFEFFFKSKKLVLKLTASF
jgi:hypothetical protein